MHLTRLCEPAKLLVLRQRGLVRREQLASHVSEGLLRAELNACRWRLVTERLVAVHNGPLSGQAELWAAVLAAAPLGEAGLCSRTALVEAGLRRWEDGLIHVLVARGVAAVVPAELKPRVRIHESRRFEPGRDLELNTGPPRCGAGRAAIDAAAWATSNRAAAGLIAGVVQQRVAAVADLRLALDLAGSIKRRRFIAGVLGDVEGGAEALSELDFIRFCRRHDFPTPEHQERRRDASGRARYLDVRLRRRDGRLLLVEVDGAIHLEGSTYWADQVRDNDLFLAGTDRMRFAAWAIRSDDPDAIRQLRLALG